MSIPNTNSFSLQDVANEIGSGNDLQEFFSLANSIGFDPAYSGNKDNLLNFRNYTHPLQIPQPQVTFDNINGTWILEGGAYINVTGTLFLPINSSASVYVDQVSNLQVAFALSGANNGTETIELKYGTAIFTGVPDPEWTAALQAPGIHLFRMKSLSATISYPSFAVAYV